VEPFRFVAERTLGNTVLSYTIMYVTDFNAEVQLLFYACSFVNCLSFFDKTWCAVMQTWCVRRCATCVSFL